MFITLTRITMPDVGSEVYIILLLIAVSTFFTWKWLFGKIIRNTTWKIVVAGIVTLIATPLIYSGLISLLIAGISYTPSRDFDASKWREDKHNRFEMAGDIVDSKMLLKRDTAEVKQALGDPTSQREKPRTWVYDMGMGGGGLGFQFNHLYIEFDSNYRVVLVKHAKIDD